MKNKRLIGIVLIVALLLLVPLVAMQFTKLDTVRFRRCRRIAHRHRIDVRACAAKSKQDRIQDCPLFRASGYTCARMD